MAEDGKIVYKVVVDSSGTAAEAEKAGQSAGGAFEKGVKPGGGAFKEVMVGAARQIGAAFVNMAADAGRAVVNTVKQAVDSVASLEQNIGGVETLFKDSADTVIANAKQAYETAGLSANEYMETVTSFAASLLQSLGGDTEKAAQYADMAIRDMSDNANKMGTDMQSIQNAYQGFAKQNYTMLDNLKLGYKLLIDGELYGPYFGPDVRSYTLKDPLPNGAHTVKVAAQNRFGLWSEWAEAEVAVVNVPGPGFFISPIPRGNNILVNIFGATIAPIIVKQPQDYRSPAPFSAYFRVFQKTWPPGLEGNMPADPNFTRQWFERANESADWQEYTGAVNVAGAAIPTASQDIDGHQYRMRLSNAVGEIYSDAATFYYGSPREAVSVAKTGEWRAETGYFLIYRDGKLIGKTYENSFVDRFAVGTHKYAAMQILPGGYYTLANAQVTVTASVDCPVIAPLAGGDWVELPYTDDAEEKIKIEKKRHTERYFLSGEKFPSVEVSEHEEMSGTVPVFWVNSDHEGAQELEKMLGKTVICKTPGNRLLVGVLDSLPISDSSWNSAYSITLNHTGWRDFVDDT